MVFKSSAFVKFFALVFVRSLTAIQMAESHAVVGRTSTARLERMPPATSMAKASRVYSSITVGHFNCRASDLKPAFSTERR
jgi:hypothetical protein